MSEPAILNAKEVCQELRVHVTTLNKMVSRGDFPKPMAGFPGKRKWRLVTVRAWVDRNGAHR